MININNLKELIGGDSQELKRNSFNPDAWEMNDMLGAITEVGRLLIPNFTIDSNNRFVYENLVYWLMGDPRMKSYSMNGQIVQGDVKKGIFLSGSVGTGKSIAMEVMSKMAYALGLKIKIGDATPISLRWKNVRTDEIVDYFVHNGEVDDFKKNPVICFQDLGVEPLEALYMGNRTNVMRMILENRGDRRDKLTLVTSNYMLGDNAFNTRYGERVASRLNQMCNYLVLGGPDRRK